MSNRRRPLEPHHRAWLAAHPERTAEWLREQFRQGFEIHHLDGDQRNDHPANLIMLDATDHKLMHVLMRRGSLVVRTPQSIGPLGSPARKTLWRLENRNRYNAYMRDLMVKWRADRKAAQFEAVGQLALFTSITAHGDSS